MLGIRLSQEAEQRLAKHAKETGRRKSVLARDWIIERLDREEIDELIRQAATLHAAERARVMRAVSDNASAAFFQMLDAEDGGYDWGPDGPLEPL